MAGRYKLPRFTLNSSYVHSRAFGDLNDPSLFFGNTPQPVVQPDARARLSFDAPNRFLSWGDLQGPWKLTLLPVYDLHTGFPYSVENQFREYVGPRDAGHFPRFSSFDLQVSRADCRCTWVIGASICGPASVLSMSSITSTHATCKTWRRAAFLGSSSTMHGESTAAN